MTLKLPEKIRREITPLRSVHKRKKYLNIQQRSYNKIQLPTTKYDTTRVLFMYGLFNDAVCDI